MPIITIFGATGTQGSAVLDAILADGRYTPRAVSRSLDSDGSKALIAKGVEVVVGNLFDKESLKKAIHGSEAVFGVTNFWDPAVFSGDDATGKGEIVQGKNLVDAAKEAGVKFFIWSSLPNVAKLSNGLYKHVYHYDNKAAIDEYLKASGVPYAVLQTGWFAENLWKLGSLTKADAGYIIATIFHPVSGHFDIYGWLSSARPHDTVNGRLSSVAGFWVENSIPKYGPNDEQSATWVGHDFGQAAVALLTNYSDASKKVVGKTFPVVSLRFTYPEFAAAIAKGIKKDVKFIPVETAGIAELDEMFAFQAKGVFKDTPFPNPDLVALGVKFGSLDEFVTKEVVPRFS
ncbi:NAD(P)-binding protein [Mycena polygramma]|nr:NAD(P)-binding protein [Mycena polygramma]